MEFAASEETSYCFSRIGLGPAMHPVRLPHPRTDTAPWSSPGPWSEQSKLSTNKEAEQAHYYYLLLLTSILHNFVLYISHRNIPSYFVPISLSTYRLGVYMAFAPRSSSVPL